MFRIKRRKKNRNYYKYFNAKKNSFLTVRLNKIKAEVENIFLSHKVYLFPYLWMFANYLHYK